MEWGLPLATKKPHLFGGDRPVFCPDLSNYI